MTTDTDDLSFAEWQQAISLTVQFIHCRHRLPTRSEGDVIKADAICLVAADCAVPPEVDDVRFRSVTRAASRGRRLLGLLGDDPIGGH